MIIISHRGNLDGTSEKENSPEHIQHALSLGYDVEVDVWFKDNTWFFGHDDPTYEVEHSFFSSILNPKATKLWIHAKNIEAAEQLSSTGMNWFWHEKDKITLTSKGNIWCYPNTYVKDGISVMIEKRFDIPDYVGGICTDHPEAWRNNLK